MLAEARHKQIEFGHSWPRLSMYACAGSDCRQLEDLEVRVLVPGRVCSFVAALH